MVLLGDFLKKMFLQESAKNKLHEGDLFIYVMVVLDGVSLKNCKFSLLPKVCDYRFSVTEPYSTH